MAINPIDVTQLVDIGEILQEVTYPFGMFADTGLYEERGIVGTTVLQTVRDTDNHTMTGTTSRRERDADRVGRQRSKVRPIATTSFKIVDAIHYEDLADQIREWGQLSQTTVQDAIIERVRAMNLAMQQNREYCAFTAAQGIMLDPRDGSEVADMVDITGQARLTDTWDLTDANFDVAAKISEVRRRLALANIYGGAIRNVDIFVTPEVFSAIVSHPSIQTIWSLANQGNRGLIDNATPYSIPRLTEHGLVDWFEYNGVRILVYPQDFRRMDQTAVPALAANKGFTVVRGLSGLYKARFSPAPYFSKMGMVGQKDFVWQTPIKNDQEIQVGHECYPVYYMEQPALSMDITFDITP